MDLTYATKAFQFSIEYGFYRLMLGFVVFIPPEFITVVREGTPGEGSARSCSGSTGTYFD